VFGRLYLIVARSKSTSRVPSVRRRDALDEGQEKSFLCRTFKSALGRTRTCDLLIRSHTNVSVKLCIAPVLAKLGQDRGYADSRERPFYSLAGILPLPWREKLLLGMHGGALSGNMLMVEKG
jgi:hypothetical protein